MKPETIHERYNWHATLTPYQRIEHLGCVFIDVLGLEQAMHRGDKYVYFQSPKGVIAVSWREPKAA